MEIKSYTQKYRTKEKSVVQLFPCAKFSWTRRSSHFHQPSAWWFDGSVSRQHHFFYKYLIPLLFICLSLQTQCPHTSYLPKTVRKEFFFFSELTMLRRLWQLAFTKKKKKGNLQLLLNIWHIHLPSDSEVWIWLWFFSISTQFLFSCLYCPLCLKQHWLTTLYSWKRPVMAGPLTISSPTVPKFTVKTNSSKSKQTHEGERVPKPATRRQAQYFPGGALLCRCYSGDGSRDLIC